MSINCSLFLIRAYLLFEFIFCSSNIFSQVATDTVQRRPRKLGLAANDSACAAQMIHISNSSKMSQNAMTAAKAKSEEIMRGFVSSDYAPKRPALVQAQRNFRAEELTGALTLMRNPGLRRAFRRGMDSDFATRSLALKRRLKLAKESNKIDADAQVYDILNIGAGPHDAVSIATYADVNPSLKCLTVDSASEYGSTFNTEGFRLNSPSRPGVDGQAAAPGVGNLNNLPNNFIQVPMLTGDRNALAQDLSDTIAVNRLVQEAPVLLQTKVVRIQDKFSDLPNLNGRSAPIENWPARYRVEFNDGTFVYTQAINEVSGLGASVNLKFLPSQIAKNIADEIEGVEQAIARGLEPRADQRFFSGQSYFRWIEDFPDHRKQLSGRRIAVIGSGDTSNTVNESLFGFSYGNVGSTVQDGQVASVLWVGQKYTDCVAYTKNTRPRYGDLAIPLKSGALQATPLQLINIRRINGAGVSGPGPYLLTMGTKISKKDLKTQQAYNSKKLTQVDSITDLNNTLEGRTILSNAQVDLSSILNDTNYDLFQSKDRNGNTVYVFRPKGEALKNSSDEIVLATNVVDSVIFGTGSLKDERMYSQLLSSTNTGLEGKPNFIGVEGQIQKPEGAKKARIGTRLAKADFAIPDHLIARSGPAAGTNLIPDDETASAGAKLSKRIKANKVSLFNWTPRTEQNARKLAEDVTLLKLAENGAVEELRHFDVPNPNLAKPLLRIQSQTTAGNYEFIVGNTRTYRGLRSEFTGDDLFLEASIESRLKSFDLAPLANKSFEIRLTRVQDAQNGTYTFRLTTMPPLDAKIISNLNESFAEDFAFHDGLRRTITPTGLDNTLVYRAEISGDAQIVNRRMDITDSQKLINLNDKNFDDNKLLAQLENKERRTESASSLVNKLSYSKDPEIRYQAYQAFNRSVIKREEGTGDRRILYNLLKNGIRDTDSRIREYVAKKIIIDQTSTYLKYNDRFKAAAELAIHANNSNDPVVREAGIAIEKYFGYTLPKSIASLYVQRAKQRIANTLRSGVDLALDNTPVTLLLFGGIGLGASLLSGDYYFDPTLGTDDKNRFNNFKKSLNDDEDKHEFVAVWENDRWYIRKYNSKSDNFDYIDSFKSVGPADFIELGVRKFDNEREFKAYENSMNLLQKINLIKKNSTELYRFYLVRTSSTPNKANSRIKIYHESYRDIQVNARLYTEETTDIVRVAEYDELDKNETLKMNLQETTPVPMGVSILDFEIEKDMKKRRLSPNDKSKIEYVAAPFKQYSALYRIDEQFDNAQFVNLFSVEEVNSEVFKQRKLKYFESEDAISKYAQSLRK